MSNKDLVLFEDLKNGVGLVKLNRPERLNAITPALSARLKEKSTKIKKILLK